MKTDNSPRLTVKQQHWLDHLNAAKSQQLGLKAYAEKEGLHCQTLYSYQSALRKKGILSTPARTAFVKAVAPTKPPVPPFSSVRIHLSNGVRLDVPPSETNVVELLKAANEL
jgi:hypothetical protein